MSVKRRKMPSHRCGGKVNDIIPVAVMPFTVQGKDQTRLAIGFQHYLSGALSAEVATIVERGQVNSVMSELVFQDSFIDINQAIQIGQSLQTIVITGTIQFQDNRATITVKRIDVCQSRDSIISTGQWSPIGF